MKLKDSETVKKQLSFFVQQLGEVNTKVNKLATKESLKVEDLEKIIKISSSLINIASLLSICHRQKCPSCDLFLDYNGRCPCCERVFCLSCDGQKDGRQLQSCSTCHCY
jgi:hypothetical protein